MLNVQDRMMLGRENNAIQVATKQARGGGDGDGDGDGDAFQRCQ